jgi:hypothetical protein
MSRRCAEMTLYTTIQSCLMCAGPILLHRIGRMVFGTTDGYGGFGAVDDRLPPFSSEQYARATWNGPARCEECDALYVEVMEPKKGTRSSTDGPRAAPFEESEMSPDRVRIVVTTILYVVVFVSGVFLTRSGKPYSTFVLMVHKLVSVAALAYLVVAIVQVNRTVGLSAPQAWASVVTGLSFLGTIATGGILSTDRPAARVLLTLHRITPFLTILVTALTLYLLLGQ